MKFQIKINLNLMNVFMMYYKFITTDQVVIKFQNQINLVLNLTFGFIYYYFTIFICVKNYFIMANR